MYAIVNNTPTTSESISSHLYCPKCDIWEQIWAQINFDDFTENLALREPCPIFYIQFKWLSQVHRISRVFLCPWFYEQYPAGFQWIPIDLHTPDTEYSLDLHVLFWSTTWISMVVFINLQNRAGGILWIFYRIMSIGIQFTRSPLRYFDQFAWFHASCQVQP